MTHKFEKSGGFLRITENEVGFIPEPRSYVLPLTKILYFDKLYRESGDSIGAIFFGLGEERGYKNTLEYKCSDDLEDDWETLWSVLSEEEGYRPVVC